MTNGQKENFNGDRDSGKKRSMDATRVMGAASKDNTQVSAAQNGNEQSSNRGSNQDRTPGYKPNNSNGTHKGPPLRKEPTSDTPNNSQDTRLNGAVQGEQPKSTSSQDKPAQDNTPKAPLTPPRVDAKPTPQPEPEFKPRPQPQAQTTQEPDKKAEPQSKAKPSVSEDNAARQNIVDKLRNLSPFSKIVIPAFLGIGLLAGFDSVINHHAFVVPDNEGNKTIQITPEAINQSNQEKSYTFGNKGVGSGAKVENSQVIAGNTTPVDGVVEQQAKPDSYVTFGSARLILRGTQLIYTVQPGDTFAIIFEKLWIPVSRNQDALATMVRLNPVTLPDVNVIEIGQEIIVGNNFADDLLPLTLSK